MAVSGLGLFGLPFRHRIFAAKPAPRPAGQFSALGLFGLPFPARSFAAKPTHALGPFSTLGLFGLPFPIRIFGAKPQPPAPAAAWAPPPPVARPRYHGRWKS